MRHILGVLGIIAATVLLAVSMAMNYKFGASLGKTPTDQQIYGMASAAADCFKNCRRESFIGGSVLLGGRVESNERAQRGAAG